MATEAEKRPHPSGIMFIRDGFEKTELALKITCAEEIYENLFMKQIH